MAALLPLFPLQVVLLPRTPLPLHIFEERYKEMIREVIASKGEFGVVLIKGEGIVNMGCTAVVNKVLRQYPDGRMDILAIGSRRFEVETIDDEKAFLRASVEFYDDEDDAEVPQPVRNRVIALSRELRTVDESEQWFEPKLDDPQVSFQIAQLISDTDLRQTILGLRSERERLEYLMRVLPAHLERSKQTALAKRVAPLNGHAKRRI